MSVGSENVDSKELFNLGLVSDGREPLGMSLVVEESRGKVFYLNKWERWAMLNSKCLMYFVCIIFTIGLFLSITSRIIDPSVGEWLGLVLLASVIIFVNIMVFCRVMLTTDYVQFKVESMREVRQV